MKPCEKGQIFQDLRLSELVNILSSNCFCCVFRNEEFQQSKLELVIVVLTAHGRNHNV